MNCQRIVPSEKAKLFLNVFACEDCYGVAMRIRYRMRKSVEQLLILLDEWLRYLFMKGEVQLGMKEEGGGEQKKEFLKDLVEFSEKKHGARARPDVGHPGHQPTPPVADSQAVRTAGSSGVSEEKP